MSLKISNKIEDQIAVLNISGEVDMFSSPQARAAIMEMVKKRVPKIIVELSEVSYMDSSGVATLIEGLQLCHKYNGNLVVANLRDNVREVFELTRLDKIFQIFPDVEAAKADA